MKTVLDKVIEDLNSMDNKELKQMIIIAYKDYCNLFEKYVTLWIVFIISVIISVIIIVLISLLK